MRQNQEIYRDLFDQAPFGIVVVSPSGRVDDANRYALNQFGVKLDELKNGPGVFADPRFVESGLADLTQRCLERGDDIDENVNAPSLSDKPVKWAVRMRSLSSPAGERVGVQILIDDSRSNTIAPTNSDILNWDHVLFEMSPNAIGQFDINLDIVRMNPAAVALFGYHSEQEMIGLNAMGFFDPADSQATANTVRKILETGSVENARHTLFRRDGTSFLSEFSASLLVGADGKPSGVMAITRDISQRAKIEQMLRESSEKFEKIFQASPLMISLTDRETGRFIEVNDAALSHL